MTLTNCLKKKIELWIPLCIVIISLGFLNYKEPVKTKDVRMKPLSPNDKNEFMGDSLSQSVQDGLAVNFIKDSTRTLLIEIKEFKNNKVDGKYILIYKDRVSIFSYKKGKRHGWLTRYLEDGTIERVSKFKHGKLVHQNSVVNF